MIGIQKNGLLRKTGDVRCSPSLLQDLKLDGLLHLPGGDILAYLTCEVGLLESRSRILQDILHAPALEELLAVTVERLESLSRLLTLKAAVDDNERALYSVKQTSLYFEILDSMEEFLRAGNVELTAPELRGLFDEVRKITEGKEYINLKKGTAALLEKIGHIKSVAVGFNLDASLSPEEAGVLAISDKPVCSGRLIDRLLRGEFRTDMDGGTLYSMEPLMPSRSAGSEREYAVLNFSLYASLGKIFRRQLRQWEPAVCEYLARSLSFLLDALPDLQFLLRLSAIQRKMQRAGLPLCKPSFAPVREKAFACTGVYNPLLAMEIGYAKVVKNDISFDETGRVYLLTGPNSGGKSVFISTLCILQIMAQLGLPLPASSAVISPCEKIGAYFPKYHSLHQKGKLAEECEGIADLFRGAGEYSFLVFDEPSPPPTRKAPERSLWRSCVRCPCWAHGGE